MKKKLTKAQMRVVIAKDALLQLNSEAYKAQKGIYIDDNLLDKLKKKYHEKYINESAQPYLDNLKKCKVCAKGSIFLSTVRKFNDVNLRNFRLDSEYKADDIFGEENMCKIEEAFELWTNNDELGIPKNTKLNKFIEKYKDSTSDERLRAILKHLIKNKGIFRP